VFALGAVEPYQQIEPYSCGAAALKAVLQHWGERVPEKTLIREVGIDPKTGSTAPQVAGAARRRGYLARAHYFRSVDELATYTSRDVPVILAIRSFTRPNQGHFVVATRVGKDLVEIMDPNVQGNRRLLSRRELDRRWQFRDRVGVIVVPKRRRDPFGEARLPSRATVGLAVLIGAAIAVGVAYSMRELRR
jgi:ABC-type bacteriocin/lantibiotic exporter with double-glycine peptidase domain